jgi:hypothetical protein
MNVGLGTRYASESLLTRLFAYFARMGRLFDWFALITFRLIIVWVKYG